MSIVEGTYREALHEREMRLVATLARATGHTQIDPNLVRMLGIAEKLEWHDLNGDSFDRKIEALGLNLSISDLGEQIISLRKNSDGSAVEIPKREELLESFKSLIPHQEVLENLVDLLFGEDFFEHDLIDLEDLRKKIETSAGNALSRELIYLRKGAKSARKGKKVVGIKDLETSLESFREGRTTDGGQIYNVGDTTEEVEELKASRGTQSPLEGIDIEPRVHYLPVKEEKKAEIIQLGKTQQEVEALKTEGQSPLANTAVVREKITQLFQLAQLIVLGDEFEEVELLKKKRGTRSPLALTDEEYRLNEQLYVQEYVYSVFCYCVSVLAQMPENLVWFNMRKSETPVALKIPNAIKRKLVIINGFSRGQNIFNPVQFLEEAVIMTMKVYGNVA